MICCWQYVIKNWTLALVNESQPEEGIKMELVLKRRIMNAVLTIYLPTALVTMMTMLYMMTMMIMNAMISDSAPSSLNDRLFQVLCIVYATNYFKDFFFEANQSIIYFQAIKDFPTNKYILGSCHCQPHLPPRPHNALHQVV